MNVYLGELYKEVEYIQSSGTQYIDTGWYPESNYCKVIMEGTVNKPSSSYGVCFGMTNGSNGYSLHMGNLNTRDWQANAGSNANIRSGITVNNTTTGTFSLETNNGALSMNIAGSTYTSTYSGTLVNSTRNLYIFAFNENGSVTWKVNMSVSSFKLYSASNTLVRDFIPCYRVSDNEIGLFDKVENKFYANAGTGTFTKGNDVKVFQAELKNAYIGEYKSWQYSYDFRGKTTTQLTNDGWTVGSGYTCDSEGLYVSNNWNASCLHNIESVKNANKITFESTYKTSTGYGHSLYCNNDSYTSTKFGIGCNQSSIWSGVEGASSTSVSASLSNVGVISVKLILDIKNGTWNYNVGSYSKSGTLTLPGSSYNNNYIGLKSNIDSGSPRCQTVKLTVEY